MRGRARSSRQDGSAAAAHALRHARCSPRGMIVVCLREAWNSGGMKVLGIDHVQLAIPPGSEAQARHFYGEVLGFTELPKPEAMRGRGGLWFQAGPVQLHLGIEEGMRPSLKAHPALVVADLAAW